jgi:uncharacterized protein (TIGR03437 family)
MFRTIVLVFVVVLAGRAQSFEEHALRISQDIQARHLPFGTILDPLYSSADSTELVTYTRCGDSATWTGHYLAAEAFRYRVTRSAEALTAAKRALNGIHSLVDVTGANNLLARCVLPTDSPLSAGPLREEASHGEYGGKFDGTDYRWVGNTSRDQYMGVFFGLSVAYELIEDASLRATISDIVTRLIDRLLEKNWAVVMPNGDTSTVFWLRVDQQLSILQVGKQVNAAKFGRLYDSAGTGLLGLRAPYLLEARDEHGSYFKFNLGAVTLYNLIRLEPVNSPRRGEYMDAYETFRDAVDSHGNAFFNVIDRALRGANVQRDAETMELLAAWLLRPRRDAYVDLRGKYRACGEDRACEPIPVAERVRTDFLWQRSPFLLYGGGDGKIQAPGIDFILPYWMARYHGMDLSLIAASAASGASTVAPDSLVTLYGAGFATGSRVEVLDAANNRVAATVLFANASQINFVLPGATGLGNARVAVINPDGFASHTAVAPVQRVAPALFSASANGRGPAAALAFRVEANGSQTPVRVFTCAGPLICLTNEIQLRDDRPVYLSLYGTGMRGRSGPATVTVGGRPVPVLYAGPQSEFAGLDQVNIQLPASLRGIGRADVITTVDGATANAVQIEID